MPRARHRLRDGVKGRGALPQGRELERAIYDQLENRARELSCEKLVLDTTVQQIAAHALYRKKGFSETGRTVMGGFDCILFEKHLIP